MDFISINWFVIGGRCLISSPPESRTSASCTWSLEFFRGRTIRYWATKLRNPDAQLHGFDSFEGPPDAWGPHAKGIFSISGKLPEIADPRVQFFKGWFEEVLPTYVVPDHDVLIMIVDADMYTFDIVCLASPTSVRASRHIHLLR